MKDTSSGLPRDNPFTSLWQKTPSTIMDSSDTPPVSPSENTFVAPITQAYMDKFLQEHRSEIVFLKSEVKTCIHELKCEVKKQCGHVDDLKHTCDTRSEDQVALWYKGGTLGEQHIELQLKQEDLENKRKRTNIRIRGISRGMEGMDIMAFTGDLLLVIRGDEDAAPTALDRVHNVASAPRLLDFTPEIVMQVHFFTEKEANLQARTKTAGLVF
ncbi:hypothetical protein NDU88_002566 [Pleurodeles waltl]|uniref:Uncharacterized protein n=1 Tax=Pleurodeles waltl TaxID=8319 RepID=A0AAV7PAD1_PLEWA|nr:hypothetical protein NDU88_002566 [Pleurodeles waltl]